MVADCFARGIQVLAHANGDAAAEQMIEAVARAERRPRSIAPRKGAIAGR